MIGVPYSRFWRQLTCCVVAYAFALHIALLSFVAPNIFGIGDEALPGFTLCFNHDADGPVAPDQNSAADEHCKLCTATVQFLGDPQSPAESIVFTATAAPLHGASDWFLPSPIKHASTRPRGPPHTA